MPIEQKHLETYRNLFVPREDVFARQTPKGSYFLRRSLVTDDVLRSHLQGEITAGFYALRPDHTARWVVLDSDQADGLDQLQEAWKQLDRQGIPSQLEGSRRGGHLWIFFEPIAAQIARRLIAVVLPDLHVEVYPKQNQVSEDGVGSLVRGPLGVHLLTGQRYPFLDPLSLEPTAGSVQATLEYLQAVPRVSAAAASEMLARFPQVQPPTELPREQRRAEPTGQRLSPIQRLKREIGDERAFIAQFVELTAQGRGHCPLHPPDESESFVVDNETGHWTCFHEVDPKTGTWLGGGAIEFYRRLKGPSYRRVIRELEPLSL